MSVNDIKAKSDDNRLNDDETESAIDEYEKQNDILDYI